MIEDIKGICPAPDWYAAYRMEDGSVELIPLACWAIVVAHYEGESWTEVVGMDAWDTCEPAEEASNFLRYEHRPQGKPQDTIIEKN